MHQVRKQHLPQRPAYWEKFDGSRLVAVVVAARKKQPREWQVKITLKIHGTSLPSEVRRFFHPMDFCNLKPVEFLDSGILHAVPSTTSLYRPFGRCKIPLKTVLGDL